MQPSDSSPIEYVGLDEPLLAQLPTFELFFKSFGFKRVHGRVWGLLVLSGQPLSSREIGQQLLISQGATSTALNELREWGAISSEFDSNRRCHLHAAVGNTLSIIATVFRRREQVVFGRFKQSARATLDYIGERYGEKDPRVLTLRSIISSCEIAEAMMQLVFSTVERALSDSESLLSRAVNTALRVGMKVPARLISQPEAADALSEAAGELSGVAGVLPEAAGVLPEAAGVLPEAADALPEAADALPEAADALPEAADTQPEVADAQPGGNGALPEVDGELQEIDIQRPETADNNNTLPEAERKRLHA